MTIMVPQKKEDFVQCNLLVKSKVTRGFQLPAICELLFVSNIKVVDKLLRSVQISPRKIDYVRYFQFMTIGDNHKQKVGVSEND